MKTLIGKSLLSSLYQREGLFPSLEKRGKGRFSNNVSLLLHFLVSTLSVCLQLKHFALFRDIGLETESLVHKFPKRGGDFFFTVDNKDLRRILEI